jgi:hypothetical protein
MNLELTRRAGPKPCTHYAIPHRQEDQTPSAAIYELTASRFLSMPGSEQGPSLISVPGARALFLPECEACNEAAFLRGREFAHIHPPSDGSFHMILSEADCAHVLDRGWGELHPLAVAGKIQPTVTMIYAARDESETDLVLEIAAASRRYALGVPT